MRGPHYTGDINEPYVREDLALERQGELTDHIIQLQAEVARLNTILNDPTALHMHVLRTLSHGQKVHLLGDYYEAELLKRDQEVARLNKALEQEKGS